MKGDQPTMIESIEAWLNAGMPPEKLNIGLALYGRTFELASPAHHDIGAQTIGPGKPGNYSRIKGYLAYYEICSKHWTHNTNWIQSKTETAYADDGHTWVSYDTPDSFRFVFIVR